MNSEGSRYETAAQIKAATEGGSSENTPQNGTATAGCAPESALQNGTTTAGCTPESALQNPAKTGPKKKRGRPRTFAQGTTVSLCVSIEARQKKWLDEVAASAPDQSASKVVREALDLWHAVHKEGKTLIGAPTQESSWIDDADDYDYSWQ